MSGPHNIRLSETTIRGVMERTGFDYLQAMRHEQSRRFLLERATRDRGLMSRRVNNPLRQG